jgi:hypothetical protein
MVYLCSWPPFRGVVVDKEVEMFISMRPARVLIVVSVLVGVLAAPAMASQPAFHFTEDVTGDVFGCAGDTYTITSGELRIVAHEGESTSGNTNFTVTVTPWKVVAEDSAGNPYRIVGAVWFGETANAGSGGFQATLTAKLQIIGQGVGRTDSVNLTVHVLSQPNNFVFHELDFGSCPDLPD